MEGYATRLVRGGSTVIVGISLQHAAHLVRNPRRDSDDTTWKVSCELSSNAQTG